jgi:hypothetical protein
MNNFCPYCLDASRPPESEDHIFPEFLGGTLTIPSCAKCNNTFGTSIEGPVSKDLAAIIVFLSFSGYKHKRLVTHKRAFVDDSTGIEYDLDSERRAYPNKPKLILENGKFKRMIVRSPKEARKRIASLKAKGLAKNVVEKYETRECKPPLRNMRVNVGTEIRQLAVKMCVAVGQKVIPGIRLLDDVCRDFLLAANPLCSPVRLTTTNYPDLDALRAPLAHLVYVEGDPATAKCFGVVQFFGGAFQLYLPLSNLYQGRSFGCLGVLDIKTFEQRFDEISPLRLAEAPIETTPADLDRFLTDWAYRFNTQVQAAFGEPSILFSAAPKQLLSGAHVTLPLIWVEHRLDIEVDLLLMSDRKPSSDVDIPN